MSEDWDCDVPAVDTGHDNDEPSAFDDMQVGRSFGKGRGFVPQVDENKDDFSSGWGGDRDDSGFGDRGRRGRGGRGDFRGRGGRGGRFNDRRNGDDNDGWTNKKSEDGWSSKQFNDNGDDRRGRGRRDNDNNFNNGDCDENKEEKERPPIYVPKQKTEDELFEETGVAKGINFGDYKNIQVNVTGSDIPPPISSFEEAKFRSIIVQNLERCRYDEPTPIQKNSIPIIMGGRDLMATAQTGSGKTAAFLLPIIHNLLKNSEDTNSGGSTCQPSALILSPTRELTTQIYEVAVRFTAKSFLKVCQLYGGTSVSYQSKQLMNGCNILIATPGRLEDFVNRKFIDFSGIKFVVLDEADRMLDMGFRSQIESFLNHSTMVSVNERQTLMFSATFSTEIQKLAGSYLHDYIFLAVGIVGGACKDVEQNFIQVSKSNKKRTLTALLEEQQNVQGTLLFVETKRTADFVASYLSSTSHPTTSIHGDRFQQQREEALRDFKSKRMHILVATSVAARGLDIKGVRHVINYDLPKEIDEYVHRIGRTGRLGNQGKATSFYDSSCDSNLATDLIKILEQAGQEVPSWLRQDASGSGAYSGDAFGGYDYRENKENSLKTNIYNQPEQIQEDESW